MRHDHSPGDGTSRSEFIRKTALAAGIVGGGAFLAGLPRLAASAPSQEQDVEILRLVLTLERLEQAFYAEAVEAGNLEGELLDYAETVGGHEREHVAFLEEALGSAAGPSPSFDFGERATDPERFGPTAVELEDLAVSAYNGQATNLTKPTLGAAARIVSVEARHAGWIRSILGQDPAPTATDAPLTAAQLREGLLRLGLVE
jgi:Ferritin-like domain